MSTETFGHLRDESVAYVRPPELDEAERVWAEGDEGELRESLGPMINKVEELGRLLARQAADRIELENTLTLTKSNLTLALSNTEMLEEALKRTGDGKEKDIGWRRWSEREGQLKRSAHSQQEEDEASSKRDSTATLPAGTPSFSTPEAPMPQPRPQSLFTQPPTESTPPPGNGFFKFRFGMRSTSAAATTTTTPKTEPPSRSSTPVQSIPNSPQPPNANANANGVTATPPSAAPHLTSVSLPSLVSGPSKREDELEILLEKEKEKFQAIKVEKIALEDELESLSAALFEQANKMVAMERIRLAEVEDELRIANEEKKALQSALRIVEGENMGLRVSASSSSVGLSVQAQEDQDQNPSGISNSRTITNNMSKRDKEDPAPAPAPARVPIRTRSRSRPSSPSTSPDEPRRSRPTNQEPSSSSAPRSTSKSRVTDRWPPARGSSPPLPTSRSTPTAPLQTRPLQPWAGLNTSKSSPKPPQPATLAPPIQLKSSTTTNAFSSARSKFASSTESSVSSSQSMPSSLSPAPDAPLRTTPPLSPKKKVRSMSKSPTPSANIELPAPSPAAPGGATRRADLEEIMKRIDDIGAVLDDP